MNARRPLLVVTAGCVAATALGLVFGEGSTVALGSALTLATALAVATALQLRPARTQQPPPRARDDEMPYRREAHRPQRIEFVRDAHRAELRGHGRAASADDNDAHQERP